MKSLYVGTSIDNINSRAIYYLVLWAIKIKLIRQSHRCCYFTAFYRPASLWNHCKNSTKYSKANIATRVIRVIRYGIGKVILKLLLFKILNSELQEFSLSLYSYFNLSKGRNYKIFFHVQYPIIYNPTYSYYEKSV